MFARAGTVPLRALHTGCSLWRRWPASTPRDHCTSAAQPLRHSISRVTWHSPPCTGGNLMKVSLGSSPAVRDRAGSRKSRLCHGSETAANRGSGESAERRGTSSAIGRRDTDFQFATSASDRLTEGAPFPHRFPLTADKFFFEGGQTVDFSISFAVQYT